MGEALVADVYHTSVSIPVIASSGAGTKEHFVEAFETGADAALAASLFHFIPAIVQNATTGQVLMLGYMNEAAFKKTLKTKRVWFYSRSKKRLWMKGEVSKNVLKVVNIASDCDGDTLLIKALPTGPTCHTGAVSCFQTDTSIDSILNELYVAIEKRKREKTKGSYTASLFKAGLDRICTKVAEESGEVIKAATKESQKRLVEESVDLIYHLVVLLVQKGVTHVMANEEVRKRRK